jgi:hypothetical protein
MKIDKIKTYQELEELTKELDNQGFGYISAWDLHHKKINDIISKSNKLNVDVKHNFKEEIQKLKDYNEANRMAEEHFSKFNPIDKIFELMNVFYLSTTSSGRVPSSRPDKNEIITWVSFKQKYGLKDEYNTWTQFDVYDLSKNMLKIHYGDNNNYQFKTFYKLIFNEECSEFANGRWDNKYGEWQDLGEIEIKFFQNGYANIKGNLKKIKELYYKYLTKRNYNMIIFFNGKKEIIKAKER